MFSLMPRELRPALFAKRPASLGIICAVVDDAPESLYPLEAARAHGMSPGQHTQLLLHDRDRERRILCDFPRERVGELLELTDRHHVIDDTEALGPLGRDRLGR